MPNAANKVKFGLKNVHYAMITAVSDAGVPTYATPVPFPGAVSLSMDPQGESTPFYADNIAYYVTVGNAGYQGDLEVAMVPDSFRVDALGDVADSKGVFVEDSAANSRNFALLFEFDGDERKTRHCLYSCYATRPSVEGETTEATKTPKTETLTLTASAVYNASLQKDIVKSRTGPDTDADTFANWYSAVYIPTASAGG